MNPKDIIDYLISFWAHRKTKWGLFLALTLLAVPWSEYVLPYYQIHTQVFYVITFFSFIGFPSFWFFYSGRIILPTSKHTVVFCLKAQDVRSAKYIQNTLSVLTKEIDNFGLLGKFRFITIGHDIISNRGKAHNYREKQNVDLVIWGEIFSGSKEGKEVCDFKTLSFTYKLPEPIRMANLTDLFSTDINIALVNRDWNIYEVNSLQDTEKISGHLSEVILFIIGIIYAQYREFAEDSIVILQNLFMLLESQTKDEDLKIDPTKNTLILSPHLVRKGRVLVILLSIYKNLGLHLVESHNYKKAIFYLEKFRRYEKKDIAVISSLALCAFYLDDIPAAKTYTEEINTVEKNHEIYTLNKAFFGIWEKNYASAIYFYKEIIKRGRTVSGDIIAKVIAFLDERKSDYQAELAYDFAIGLLNYYHCQKKLGIQELRKFVKQARKKPEYYEIVCFVEKEILFKRRKKR